MSCSARDFESLVFTFDLWDYVCDFVLEVACSDDVICIYSDCCAAPVGCSVHHTNIVTVG